MKKSIDLWVHQSPILKKLLMEITISILIVVMGISNVMAFPAGGSDPELQQEQVAGTVTDDKGAPLPGVSIVVRGTTLGTLSDANGKYTLPSVPQNATLIFSFIGMANQEIVVSGRTQIDVVLLEEAIGLNEVVVIGYGTAQRRDLTGSVKSISMEDIPSGANMSLTQALRGSTAGLNVQGGGSRAGDEPSLSIRGQNTLSASTSPLIVLDGIIFQGSMSDINIEDVERVEVLKDASASAVYGSRSANGVLLVTTKKGKRNSPSINFSSYAGFQDYTNNPVKMMNADQYAKRLVDYIYLQYLYNWYKKMPTGPADFGGKPEYPDVSNPSVITAALRSPDEVANYNAGNEINWIDVVTQRGLIQNYDLSLSGASEKSNYYISGSYADQEGVQVNDHFNRTTLNTKVETEVLEGVTVGLTTAYSFRDYSGLEATMDYARNASPLASMYDAKGNYPVDFYGEFLQRHPLRNNLVDDYDIRNNFFVVANAKIEIPKVKGLSYNFDFSNNSNSEENNTFIPATVYEGLASKGQATREYSKDKTWGINNILTYVRDFNTDHRVNATLLYSYEKREGSGSNMSAVQFDNASLGYNNMSLGKYPVVGSGKWDESSLAYMARANYVLKNRYMVTGTLRKDGYSGFGAANKFATFPSLSFAWIASDESFVKNQEWLNTLKLRVSYGENGNQGIGRYSSLARMGISTLIFGSSPVIGIYPSSLGNDELGWETTVSFNTGIDYAILDQRISGSIDVYLAHTNDVLVRRSLPPATGYTSVWTNIGRVDNKGIEFELNTVNLKGPLSWESSFIFSLNRDKIADLYGDGKDDIGNSWFIGEPISSIYNYERTGGLYTEEELYNKTILTNFYPGQFRLRDLNGDNLITANDDRKIVGYATPNYRFSISNRFSYKNLSLSFFINSIQGGNGYYLANNRAFLEATSDYDYAQRTNQPAIRENWLPHNGVDDAPGIYNYPTTLSGNYQDRSFVRLQDLTLTYNLDKKILDIMKMQGLQVYINAKNPYTWTKWQGYDPEIGGTSALLMRSIILGIRVKI